MWSWLVLIGRATWLNTRLKPKEILSFALIIQNLQTHELRLECRCFWQGRNTCFHPEHRSKVPLRLWYCRVSRWKSRSVPTLNPEFVNKVQPHCRGGEIGRRTRLKIWREQSRGGSIPPNEFWPFYECPFLLNPLQLLLPQLFTHIPHFLQCVSKISFFLFKKDRQDCLRKKLSPN